MWFLAINQQNQSRILCNEFQKIFFFSKKNKILISLEDKVFICINLYKFIHQIKELFSLFQYTYLEILNKIESNRKSISRKIYFISILNKNSLFFYISIYIYLFLFYIEEQTLNANEISLILKKYISLSYTLIDNIFKKENLSLQIYIDL